MAISAGSPSLPKTETQLITINKSWSWSIQPAVIWIRILGVNLPDVYPTSFYWHYRGLMFFYGVLCFLANAFSQISILYYLYISRIEDQLEIAGGARFNTAVASWNLIIDFCNYAINGMGTQIIFLFVIRPRWYGLLETFQRSQVTLNDESFSRIWKISFLGIAYIIVAVSWI